MAQPKDTNGLSRSERRRQKNREKLLLAAEAVFVRKGIEAATIQDITEKADVGLGTVYNYFSSKEELAIAVVERVINRLALKIEKATKSFDNPAQVYAYGARSVMEMATTDKRLHWLLPNSEVFADVLYRNLGPYAINDIEQAVDQKIFTTEKPDFTWRLATYIIAGISLAIIRDKLLKESIDKTVVELLVAVGMSAKEAHELSSMPRPELPKKV